jgi:glycosyltransferase involved in cell wall biosynthesis
MLLPLMAKADVLVVPSLCYENSPTVIYESLGMGMPVLAADIGGVAELIKEGLNGWVFPANDWEAMNKKILGIQKQRDKVKAMGDNCRVSVKDNSLEKYTDKILKLIHNE